MIITKFDTRKLEKEIDNFAKRVNTDILTAGVAAAAKVVYDEAKERAPVSAKGHWFYGTHQRYWFPAGNLKNSIYRVLSEDNSGEGYVTYHISWNYKKAPYGFMVEFGKSGKSAHPFLRPAWEAVKHEAGRAGIAEMKRKFNDSR